MIRLERVSVSHPRRGGRRHVLRELSLTLPRGRSLAVLGGPGTGKSTLLGVISGVLRPDSGRVTREVRVSAPLGKAGGVHNAMTARQHLRFAARVHGAEPEALIADARALCGLGPWLDVPLGAWSHAMRARLAFAVWLHAPTEVRVVDDLAGLGDDAFRPRALEALERRLAEGDVVMVSRSPARLRAHCDCAVLLGAGPPRAFDDLEEGLDALREADRHPRLPELSE